MLNMCLPTRKTSPDQAVAIDVKEKKMDDRFCARVCGGCQEVWSYGQEMWGSSCRFSDTGFVLFICFHRLREPALYDINLLAVKVMASCLRVGGLGSLLD